MSYIDFEAPDELKNKTLDFVKKVTDKNGKVRKGMNESTKAIERGIAKIVIIAGDISPAEIVMHLPKIAQEKKVPYTFVNTKAELGKSAGITIPCSALAVLDIPKEAEADLKAIVKDVSALRK
ncbi:50S ribosomal protein L7Ae [Candidatus Lokiarchaeum ossiferum]|uniref:50S ribosomal protein L7Ae n=1 Tax=Candidatus Lokiarchaeum ossiferum TaxID=2951803 RepID=A0ABY6HNB2_9ARCH|nr:50S ribosomal protein L7Ae [Candidatus Lokiarchaeum sp. B-35]